MNETHFRKLENMYHIANCNDYYAPKLTIAKGSTKLIIPVQEKFFHAGGAVHGSVYFKALDDAAFFAANSLLTEYLVLTANFNLYLLRPISKGSLIATGQVVNQSTTQFIAESLIFNDEGREIARGSGTFVKSKILLTSEIGYQLSS